MKDSRIGSFGAAALVFAILMKAVFVYEIEVAAISTILVAVTMFARFSMAIALSHFPSARPEGLGHTFKKYSRKSDLALQAVMTLGGTTLAAAGSALALGEPIWAFVTAALAVGTIVIAVSLILSKLFTKALGGLTGDCYGAMCEISESIGLFAGIFSAKLLL